MTPDQRVMARSLFKLMAAFYADPENERKFQEWKKERERELCATNVSRVPKQPQGASQMSSCACL